MKIIKLLKNPYVSLASNFIYALANSSVGFSQKSWWFITTGAYYTILAVTRFSVHMVKLKAKGDLEAESFAKRITGILLIALSFCIVGVNVLSIKEERGTVFHEIIMISISTYTFTKITLAIINMVKAKNSSSPAFKTLRNIALADAFVSIFTMQRSMLVSFPGLEVYEIQIFNILTGTAVWLVVLLLGINLIGGKYTDMAKSKIIKANEKIANAVVSSYKAVEKGTVAGYKKIEESVVAGYTKIEDKFIDAYLTKEGETLEEAKTRLKNKNQ